MAALIRQLGDPDWEKRDAASNRLAARGEAILPALREALRDPDSEVRSRAATIIDMIRLGMTPELRAKVGNLLNGFDARDPDEKQEILDRLVRLGGRSAVPALERMLRVEREETFLENVLRQLEGLDEATARRVLARLAESPEARSWHVEAYARRLAWRGDLAGALAAYERALARRIGRPSLRLAYAETLYAAGMPARAVPVMERLETDGQLPSDPEERARSKYWLAESLFAVGRFADAFGRYTEAADGWRDASDDWTIGREDLFSMAAQRMGECLRRLDRSQEAEERWNVLLGLGADGPPGENVLLRRLRVAELLRRDGQVDRALEVSRQVLKEAGADDDLSLRYRAAQLLAYAGRLDEALDACRRLTHEDGRLVFPPAVELFLRLAGRPAEALEVRRAGLAAAPNEVAQHLEAAAAAERAGLFDEAESLYRDAMERFPRFPMPRRRLAELHARLGAHRKALDLGVLLPGTALRCHEALGELDKGIALGERHLADRARGPSLPAGRDEEELRLLATLARLYRRKGLHDKAVACLTDAQDDFRGRSRTFDYHFALGRVREEAGETDRAIVEYLLAWHHSGLRAMDIQEARRRAAYLAAQEPDAVRAALEAFRRREGRAEGKPPGAAVRSADVSALLLEAEFLALAGDFEAAAAMVERADVALPRKPGIGCRAGRLLFLAGKADAARRRLEKVVAEWPDDPVAYRHLERIARAGGDAAAADRYRAKADAAGALDKKVCFDAAHHFMTIGDLDGARAEWRKVAAAPGERFYYDTNAHEYLGHLAARAGDDAAAGAFFRRVLGDRELRESGTVEEGGTVYAARVAYGDGIAAETRGDRTAAEAACTKAVRLDARFPEARVALARIAAGEPERAKQRAAAVAIWRDRIVDAPRDPEPRYRLAKLLLDMPTPGNEKTAREKARRLAREARDRWPGNALYEALVRQLDGNVR